MNGSKEKDQEGINQKTRDPEDSGGKKTYDQIRHYQ